MNLGSRFAASSTFTRLIIVICSSLYSTKAGLGGADCFVALGFRMIANRIRQMYAITAENAALDKDRVTAAYERLDTLLENRRYLVGDRFSRADLTLAALAAPTWRPPEHSTYWPPDELYPDEITAFRARFAKTRTREHVLRMYREHRLPKLDSAHSGMTCAAPPLGPLAAYSR